jgi:hypothetical protein
VELPDAIKEWRINLPGNVPAHPAAAARERLSLTGILQQHWWWWMVLGAILALMLEMSLAELKRSRA